MIPSYDDLTPGIPDVLESESVTQLALFLRDDLRARSARQEKSGTADSRPRADRIAALYACLRHAPQAPGTTREPHIPDPEPPAAIRARQHAGTDEPGSAQVNAAQALLTIARDFSPRVMAVSDCEVLLDVSGLGALIGEPAAIAKELVRALAEAGVHGTVAIAPTQTMARLLATRGHGFPIAGVPELPVALLQPLERLPPAMNHRDRARPYDTFERWGIVTLGDLAALPPAGISARLGRRGVALQRLARGRDATPFVPDRETPRYVERLELEWPLDALEPLSFVFARLLEPLSVALERADRGAAAVRLDLRLTDRATHARVLQLPAPIRDARVLRTLLLLDLESHPPAAAVDIVTIELDPAPARITQFSLLQRALPSPETLSTLTARLAALVGEPRIGSPTLDDSHRPDAFVMTRYAPEARAARVVEVRSGEPRPCESCSSVLRRQRVPPAVRVSVEHGRPVSLAASRRGMPQGAVTDAAGPWRTSGGWWTASDAPPGGKRHAGCPWNRDEWDVSLASGAVCRIFQDRTTERWFLEGIYD